MRLAAFSKTFPAQSVAVEECVLAAGQPPIEAKAFRRIFGIKEVRKYKADFDIAQVLPPLMDAAQAAQAPGTKAPDTFIYVHACPLHALSACDQLKTLQAAHPFLADIKQVYEMDQNCCAGKFWALEAARNMLRRGLSDSVVIVAGESFSDLPLAERYMPACTVLGDAFTAMVVDAQTGGTQIKDIVLHSNPEFHFGLYASEAEVAQFNRAQVRLTSEMLDGLDYEPGSGEPILPHNINSFSWDQYCASSGTPRDDVWLNLLNAYGHCCCTDAFLNIDRFAQDASVNSAVLVGVGQGGFVGGCRMQKTDIGGDHATC